ncbi:MAG: hypothetical protein COA58_08220 [Bacteroidetes bacterium]|nr:MAG: hypothetical protein COA58_08220 [Bacteroidota bacterium]
MRFLAIILLFTVSVCYADEADKLYDLAQSEVETAAKIELLKKAYRIKKYSNLQTALSWNKEALVLARENGVDSLLGYVLNDMGIIYGVLGEVDSTLKYYKESRDVHSSYGSNIMVAVCNSNIGLVYSAKGQFSLAIESYDKAIATFRKHNGQKYLSGAYRSLGNLYKKYKLFDKAQESLNSSLALAIQMNLKKETALAHYSLASLYEQTNDCTRSLSEGLAANAIFKELNQPRSIARCDRNIGHSYVCAFDYNKALRYYNKALDYFKKGRKRPYYHLLIAIGEVHFKQENYKLAQDFIHRGLEPLDSSVLNNSNQQLANYILGEIALKLGDYEDALKYQSTYNELRQRENEKRMQNAILTKSQMLEREEQLENLQILKKEREIRIEELDKLDGKNKALKRTGLGVFFLLVIFSAVLWINKQGSIRAERYGKELLVVSDDLKKSLDEKDSLLREIHHRVKNNLQLISSILSLEQGLGKTKTVNQIIEDSSAKIKSMALIHELFYSNKNEEEVNIAEYTNKLAMLILDSYGDTRSIKIHQDCDNVFISIERVTTLGLVINECLSNSIKYAFTKEGIINLMIREENGNVKIVISDNGRGLPIDFDLTTVKSLGLKLIRRLTEKQLQGKYTIENMESGGVRNIIIFSKT